MEEATRGDPKIHTPSTVLVQPIERVRFQGRGQESSGPHVLSVSLHVSVCVHAPFTEHIYVWCKTDGSKSGGASFPPALISHVGM